MTSNTSTEKTTEKLTDLTQREVIESLTGYEELAIKEKFKATLGALFDEAISTAQRGLAFVLYTRQENGPKDAYKAAMTLTVGQLDDVFATDDDDEVFDEDPVTPAGKDVPQLEKRPTSSPTSAS